MDGYIADNKGKLDWLPQPSSDHDFGYSAFLKDIDITLFGSKTYEQVVSFGDWPYVELDNYVFSQRKLKSIPSVQIIKEEPAAFVQELKKAENKNIWLVGGAKLIDALLRADLIDELIITQCPVLLGTGIPLFHRSEHSAKLELIHSESFEEGVVQMHYRLID